MEHSIQPRRHGWGSRRQRPLLIIMLACRLVHLKSSTTTREEEPATSLLGWHGFGRVTPSLQFGSQVGGVHVQDHRDRVHRQGASLLTGRKPQGGWMGWVRLYPGSTLKYEHYMYPNHHPNTPESPTLVRCPAIGSGPFSQLHDELATYSGRSTVALEQLVRSQATILPRC